MDSDEEKSNKIFLGFEYKYKKNYYYKILHWDNIIKLVC